ncbi:TPA: hypothetical protein N2C32_001511 [Pseudomonas aeruginosa]|nr:hypothetical protein [Pseudomonas aeruginosa]
MTNELTDVRCPCGDEFPADSYDAGFIAGSGMCQNCDAAMPPKDIPAPVEQAGGDERDLQGAQGERDGWGPFPIVKVPWNVFDRAVMWVEDRRRYGDDGTIVDDWKALKTIQRAALAQPSPAQAEQAEAERPEVVAWQYRVTAGPQTGWSLWHPGKGEEFERSYTVERRPLMTVAQHERITAQLHDALDECDGGRWKLRSERDAALAKLAELEAKLSDPTAVHQWQFSNAWFDGSEEVVLKAGKEGSPIRTLYTAPVAQAQPEETPGEILAAKLIETWVTKHGKPAPWSTAVEITAVATNMPNDERDRLLALDDDVDAQAQHSVPEGWRIERSAERIVVMNLKNGAGYAAARDGESGIAESVLYLLAADLLAAAPGKEVGHE